MQYHFHFIDVRKLGRRNFQNYDHVFDFVVFVEIRQVFNFFFYIGFITENFLAYITECKFGV